MRFSPPVALTLLAALAACSPDSTSPDGGLPPASIATGATVYTSSNAADGNMLLAFRRQGAQLVPVGQAATGGLGTGGGLGNQGALALDQDRRFLYVVNAGSDELSVFDLRDGRPTLRQRIPSGGDQPISVTVRGRLLYVLNDGAAPNITGFRVGPDGRVERIAGASAPLSDAMPDAAQVAFAPHGGALVVTEKATNRILSFPVGRDGRPGTPRVIPSAGATPFGFGFTPQGALIVSEAFGGAPDGSALSSYRGTREGAWRVVSASVGSTETAACWIVVTGNGRYAYTTNTGSGTVSGYAVSPDGRLRLLDADGVTAAVGGGSGPIDAALGRGDGALYVLAGGSDELVAYEVGRDGQLTEVARGAGLPAAASGLAVR